MSTPRVDPYPEPVALTALDLKRVQRMQVEKGRDARLRRLARRNRDVAWLLDEQERSARSARPAKPAKGDVK
ncbi:MAG TPA: hypothetical protein PKM73_18930 [Verrucomicrobiota bacterium]|nr:hypothetical protein [Verrucomicrobiota bacterium]HNU53336.1 hypothetical protein [Verrucomicrobiota bacterium]